METVGGIMFDICLLSWLGFREEIVKFLGFYEMDKWVVMYIDV